MRTSINPLRHCRCALRLTVVAACLGMLGASPANAEIFHASTFKQLEKAVASANGNGVANTIELTAGTYQPTKTLIFTNKGGTQTIAGPVGSIGVATPGAKISGTNVVAVPGTSEHELFTASAGVSLALKHVVVTGGGGGGSSAIEDLGNLNVENATIDGNTGTQINVHGGATASLTNSTLADGIELGMADEGEASFLNVTVVRNGTGGIGGTGAGTLHLTNTIVALNTSKQCGTFSTLTNDHSLASDESCGGEAAFKNKTPLLQTSLSNDGGSTTLYSEKAGSPTIDAGDEAKCPATDQRGYPRPDVAATACDIGADEYSPTLPTIKVPAEIVTSVPVVTYSVEATDPDALVKSLSCVPASGSTFKVGTTKVECTAVDGHENTAKASFNVKVTTPKHTLKVEVKGEGTVTSTPAGINCGQGHTECSAEFEEVNVTLTPAPAAGFSLTAWGEACSGTGACAFNPMSANESVTATFSAAPQPPAGGITIGGTPHVGETLHITKGGKASEWTAAEGSLTYGWEDCEAAEKNCSPIEGGPEYTLTALDVGKYVHVSVTAKNKSGETTAHASTAEVEMVHAFPVNVHGAVPYTETLTSYCTEVDLGKFIPAQARTYTGTCGVTATDTDSKSTLTAEDAVAATKGHLVHNGTSKEFALKEALEVKAADAEKVAGLESGLAPLTSNVTLRSFLEPVSADAVTLTFSQKIGLHERLNTGVYAKTITVTLSATEP
jgi:hypothetical protein